MENLIIISKQVANIEWGKEQAIKEANEIMAKYEGIVFEESDLPLAKKEIATLRKVSKEINSQALAIDKELTSPVKTFRSEVKEVKAIIDNGINYINEQVKAFEDKQSLEREKEIRSWQEFKDIEEYNNFLPEWLLKKWNDKLLKELFITMKKDLDTSINTIKMSCNTLKLDSEFYIKKLKTLPYEQIVERMNEDYSNVHKQVEETPQVIKVDVQEKVMTITRELKGTMTQFKTLKKYAEQIGIIWVIPND